METRVMEVPPHAIDLKPGRRMHLKWLRSLISARTISDYHKDMRSYFLAKKRLFFSGWTESSRVMVLNMDDPQFQELNAIAPSQRHLLRSGSQERCVPVLVRLGWSGIEATLHTAGALEVRSALPGKRTCTTFPLPWELHWVWAYPAKPFAWELNACRRYPAI